MNRIFSRRLGALPPRAVRLHQSAFAQDSERRAGLRAAFIAADSGQLTLEQAQRWSTIALSLAAGGGDQAGRSRPSSRARAAGARGDGRTAGRALAAHAWLPELARREDWASFRAAWRDSDDVAALPTCARAWPPARRCRLGRRCAEAVAVARSLPDACDAPMAKLAELGKLDEGLRWQRIDLAIRRRRGGRGALRRQGPGRAGGRAHRCYAAYMPAPPAGWTPGRRTSAAAR
jgi:soluble lytic murein transglycosylase